MPFQKGDDKRKQNGGRKSLKDEYWHKDKWELDSELEVLFKKVATGIFSIRDRALLMALQGDKDIIKKFMDKCLADLHDHRGKDGKELFTHEEVVERVANLSKKK